MTSNPAPACRGRAWLGPAGATESELKRHKLTNLDNALPPWLIQAHAALDCAAWAAWAAYGWADPEPEAVADDIVLAQLPALALIRASSASD